MSSMIHTPNYFRLTSVALPLLLALVSSCVATEVVQQEIQSAFAAAESEWKSRLDRHREDLKEASDSLEYACADEWVQNASTHIIAKQAASSVCLAGLSDIEVVVAQRIATMESEVEQLRDDGDRAICSYSSAKYEDLRLAINVFNEALERLLASADSLEERQARSLRRLSAISQSQARSLGAAEDYGPTSSTVEILPLHLRQVVLDMPAQANLWMALGRALVEQKAMSPFPASVSMLLNLDAASISDRESKSSGLEDKFLLRALKNYRLALESLAADGREVPDGWKAGWDAERDLLYVGWDRPAPRRWIQSIDFRTALLNKAYVLDAFIRRRGGTTAIYDRIEMAFYLDGMAWCAKKLGRPLSNELEALVNRYGEALSEHMALQSESDISSSGLE